MQLLSLIFVLGLALASAVPLFPDNINSANIQGYDGSYFRNDDILSADTFRDLRDILRDNTDEEIFKKKVEELFGKGTELSNSLLDALKEEGRDKVINFFTRLIGDEEVDDSHESSDIQNADISSDILKELRDILRDNTDNEIFIKKVEEVFGKGTKMSNLLIEGLKEEGKRAVINFLNRLIGYEILSKSANSDIQNADISSDILKELRDILRDNTDNEIFIKKVEEVFGKGTKMSNLLIEGLKEEGKRAVINFLNRLIGYEILSKSANSARRPAKFSIKDIFHRLREYLLKDDFDAEKFKDLVEKLLTKDSMAESILDTLRNKGEHTLIDFFDRFLGDRADIPFSGRSIENADFNFFEIFRKLKNLIKDNVDTEKLKEQIEKFFGKGSELAEQLIDLLKSKGKLGRNKIIELIDRILGENQKKRSIQDIYGKVRDYFKDLHIELKEKFLKFGEYAKEQYQQVLDKSKTKAENIKRIAQEFLNDGRKMSKEIAEEALGFFREYKEDLGRVYDHIVSKVREITKKKD